VTDPLPHYTRVTASDAEPERWLAVLHGIYGTGRNWASVIRRVVKRRPEWGALLVDLRGHGGSVDLPGPATLEAAADDVRRLAEATEGGVAAVLGHSFGGKVALLLARSPWPGLRAIWVVDSDPGTGDPEAQGLGAWRMLEILREHPGPFPTRETAVETLVSRGLEPSVARWMAMNVEEDGFGGWAWRIDPEVMESLLRDFFSTDTWDVVESPPAELRLHMVKATDSPVLDEATVGRLEKAAAGSGEGGQTRLHRVAGGHWVNVDNPDAVVELLAERL
jgi:pimeloyl-ACP methyl ester carboxylesterase